MEFLLPGELRSVDLKSERTVNDKKSEDHEKLNNIVNNDKLNETKNNYIERTIISKPLSFLEIKILF